MLDTKTVEARRHLEFDTIDQCVAEIDAVVVAHRDGRLQTLGNWTAGQNMAHVAAWIEYGWEGYPIEKPPFYMRWVLRSMFKRILKKGMPPGAHIPGLPEGTLGQDEMETEAAAERLKKAFARLKAGEQATVDSPAFGKMTHDQRIKLNLRHAALHLGFLTY